MKINNKQNNTVFKAALLRFLHNKILERYPELNSEEAWRLILKFGDPKDPVEIDTLMIEKIVNTKAKEHKEEQEKEKKEKQEVSRGKYFSRDEDFLSKLKAFYSSSQYRKSGRTFALARTLIEISIEELTDVNLIDHIDSHTSPRKQGRDHVLHAMREAIRWYEERGVKIKTQYREEANRELFRFSISEGFENYCVIRIKNHA